MYILLSPREEEVRSLLEGADEHIQQHIYQKDLKTFVCHYITMPRLLLNWKKYKEGIQLCYDPYNQIK